MSSHIQPSCLESLTIPIIILYLKEVRTSHQLSHLLSIKRLYFLYKKPLFKLAATYLINLNLQFSIIHSFLLTSSYFSYERYINQKHSNLIKPCSFFNMQTPYKPCSISNQFVFTILNLQTPFSVHKDSNTAKCYIKPSSSLHNIRFLLYYQMNS